jgi:hypothetical protein
MFKWMTGLAILLAALLAACGRAQGSADRIAPQFAAVPALPARPAAPADGTSGTAGPTVIAAGLRQLRRTSSEDPDADGIADYRIIITETFDATGNLISSASEEDFEADGIIDARSVTTFGDQAALVSHSFQ